MSYCARWVGWHALDEVQRMVGDIVTEGEGVGADRGNSPIVAGFIPIIIPCFSVYFKTPAVEFQGFAQF